MVCAAVRHVCALLRSTLYPVKQVAWCLVLAGAAAPSVALRLAPAACSQACASMLLPACCSRCSTCTLPPCRISADRIQVAINLNGYTKGARNEIFALLPAPVQASYMGFPATTGAPWLPYLITDKVSTDPPGAMLNLCSLPACPAAACTPAG